MKSIVAVLALLLALSVAACGGGSDDDDGGEGGSDAHAEVERIAEDLEPPLDKLGDALDAAVPQSRQTMLDVRAAAEEAAEPLDDAEVALNDVAASGERDEELVAQAEEAIGRLSNLDDALLDEEPDLDRIEDASEAAKQAVADLEAISLPTVDASGFVALLRAEEPQGGDVPPPDQRPAGQSGEIRYRTHDTDAFRVKLPVGGGWSTPLDTEPNPGKLFRSETRNDDLRFLIVDYTPFEQARFRGKYLSRDSTGRTATGASATRYVFRGGDIEGCRANRCVDYVLNTGNGVDGFAVLAGGPDFEAADAVAQRVVNTVTPLGRGG